MTRTAAPTVAPTANRMVKPTVTRLLIANRGEIARRVIRTAQRLSLIHI
jgi:pyruvate carboxylase